jgi:ribosome-associated toxin RatA of RatAB toxin-antitoxin module
MKIARSALVLHPARDMYSLVHDVGAYPEFLSWCTGSHVLEQDERRQVASLEVAIAGARSRFTTRNRLLPHERLEMRLVEGPFRSLEGAWEFQALGEAGSRIGLSLEFQLSSGLVSNAFGKGFARVADRLVKDFCARADAVYGNG